MKIKFRKNNKVNYMQDHSFKVGIPDGIMFDVEILRITTRIKLVAPGYGELRGDYGNGALFMLVTHLPKSLRNKVEWEIENG